MRFRWRDRPIRAFQPSGKEELEQAKEALKLAEQNYQPFNNVRKPELPGSVAERLRKAVEAARKKYDGLRFIFVDHAPDIPLSQRLKALNQRNAEFWGRRGV